jgi:hypothetical protein
LARSALLNRLDAARERWKSPRFAAIFVTVLLPGIISFPTWYKQRWWAARHRQCENPLGNAHGGRLMLTILGGLAEFERSLIKARTASGRERRPA